MGISGASLDALEAIKFEAENKNINILIIEKNIIFFIFFLLDLKDIL